MDRMATLEELKPCGQGADPEVQTELLTLFHADSDAARRRMVELSAEQGMRMTTEEVRGFLRQKDDKEEFDDIELDVVGLAAIAGGRNSRGSC